MCLAGAAVRPGRARRPSGRRAQCPSRAGLKRSRMETPYQAKAQPQRQVAEPGSRAARDVKAVVGPHRWGAVLERVEHALGEDLGHVLAYLVGGHPGKVARFVVCGQ